jgi:uracil-DNA glycosylase
MITFASTPTTAKKEVKLEPSWKKRLSDEFDAPYMVKLRAFLQAEIKADKTIYPKPSEYFNAFQHTPFDKVEVVILGQDPYHGPGQAHGLCFSVRPPVPPPPSLLNIFKELEADIPGFKRPSHGCLTSWADQGVLLLNSVLTVEAGKAGSHQNQGWEIFTDKAIACLNEEREGIVFILWGAYAQKKGQIIDRSKHHVLSGPHPSPLSSHRGFFGSKPFSKTNAYLRKIGRKEINWNLPTKAEA